MYFYVSYFNGDIAHFVVNDYNPEKKSKMLYFQSSLSILSVEFTSMQIPEVVGSPKG